MQQTAGKRCFKDNDTTYVFFCGNRCNKIKFYTLNTLCSQAKYTM